MHTLVSTTMCKNEPFAAIGLLSIIDYVDKCIVVDTGSDDGTWDELNEVRKMYPNKVLLEQRIIGDGHNWNITGGQVNVGGVPEEVAIGLGDIRRYMHDKLNSKWVVSLDGDEVWDKSLVEYVRGMVEKGCYGNVAIFLPFMDFIEDITKVRQYHWMGRVYNRQLTQVLGQYPAEMHYVKLTKECLQPTSRDILMPNPDSFGWVRHFECLLKPHRKEHKIVGRHDGSLPEVIDKYKDRFPRVKPYLEIKE